MTTVTTQLYDALKTAKNGLEWFYDEIGRDGSDDENMAAIDAAIEAYEKSAPADELGANIAHAEKQLKEAQDALSEKLEDPIYDNHAIRDAAIDICGALNTYWQAGDAIVDKIIDEVMGEDKLLTMLRNWDASSEQINALPEKLRHWVMWLQVDADPAGTLGDNWRLHQENAALRKLLGEGNEPFAGEAHPRHDDWRLEVYMGDTLLGFADWMQHNPEDA